MADLVSLDVEGSIATITWDSPANRNALSGQLMDELLAHLRQAEACEAVRVVVLTAIGSTFCSGADMGAPMDQYPVAVRSLLEEMWDYPKTLLAAVNGHVRGGGIGLVAAADIAVAVEGSTFSFSEVRLGLVPTMVAVLCVRQMSSRYLSRYCLTGEVFTASEAQRAGLVTAVAPDGALDADISSLTGALRLGEPGALAMTKGFLRELSSSSVETSFARATEVATALARSEAVAEGVRAFKARRPPAWAIDST